MNAVMESITVMLTQIVVTQMGVLLVLVMQDTVVMESAVMVNNAWFYVS